MSLPLNKRSYDIFLSHSHSDAVFADLLYTWLTGVAGLKVWFDKTQLGPGSLLATDLQAAIGDCRSIILIVSGESMSKGWVRNEYNSAIDERANNQDFRIIAIKIGESNTKDLMKGTTWIEIDSPEINAKLAYGLIQGLYPSEKQLLSNRSKDLYVSCSWRPSDATVVKTICSQFVSFGFRLIGDSKDQAGFSNDQDRIERLIRSCGGLLAIIPFRDASSINDPTYKYFVKEIAIAQSHNIPIAVFLDSRLNSQENETLIASCSIDENNIDPNLVSSHIERLWDEWIAPPVPHFIFCALDLELDISKPGSMYRTVIESITGTPTIVGSEVQGSSLHEDIAKTIEDAFLIIADITNDNVNSCIEAGMAIMAKKFVRLISSGKNRNPPFMLRGAGQLRGYNTEADLIGITHKIARPFRRRVINLEL
jgi:hypothetical protein